ncbi:pyruvate ferredoxin oxidoreductase gamma subunit [Phycisphaerales bacterium]|nr:pyruvate ferredoxin oxidoreductase gamma subunit [Phycisphaerales bacterium]
MFQVRIHGRGGQGVVTGAELLSVAAFLEGRWAQAFPSFGSERMGAPVMAFCRIDDKEIRAREPVTQPDAVIIQDPTLLQQSSVFEGLAPNGWVLINSGRTIQQLGIARSLEKIPGVHVSIVPATELALKHIGRPVPNAVLLGGLCAAASVLKLDSVEAAIRQKFRPDLADRNIAAARAAFSLVTAQPLPEGAIHAQAV